MVLLYSRRHELQNLHLFSLIGTTDISISNSQNACTIIWPQCTFAVWYSTVKVEYYIEQKCTYIHTWNVCIKHEILQEIIVWTGFVAVSWVDGRWPSCFTTGRSPGSGKWQEWGWAVLSYHWCPPPLPQRTREKVDRTLSHYMSRSSLCMYASAYNTTIQCITIQYNALQCNTMHYSTVQFNT